MNEGDKVHRGRQSKHESERGQRESEIERERESTERQNTYRVWKKKKDREMERGR